MPCGEWLSTRRMKSAVVGLIGCVVLQSCGPMISSKEIEQAAKVLPCGAFGPITWSRKDTDSTINQIKNHNDTYEGLCK